MAHQKKKVERNNSKKRYSRIAIVLYRLLILISLAVLIAGIIGIYSMG
ncbi:hypothetical protein [Eudoraea chungangensis]|nr:hypothetical protein [Eudoraea chungangensis]